MRNAIFILLIFLLTFNSFGNDKIPDNKNQEYITNDTKRIRRLDSVKFKDGYFIKGLDTVFCKIYRKGKKTNTASFLYVIVRFNSDSVKVLTSKDIDEYRIGNELFYKHIDNDGTSYFINRIKTGKIILYQRDAIPSDSRFAYFFHFKGFNTFYYLTPFEKELTNNGKTEIIDPRAQRINAFSNNINANFTRASFKLFEDCSNLINKIRAGLYTVMDIEKIIDEYNKCK